MSGSRTRNATLSQIGTANTVLGVWANGATGVTDPGVGFWPIIMGLRYQLRDSTTEEPTRICTLTLNLDVVETLAPAVLTDVYVAIEMLGTTAVFSNLNLPIYPDGALGGTGWEYFGVDDGTGWSAPTAPASISIPLGTAITDPVVGTVVYGLAGQSYATEDSNAGGIINLSLRVLTGLGAVAVTPTLVVEELSAFTGITNHGVERGRPVRDMRTGLPVHTDDLVEDGYRPGIWTVPAQWDPADPRDEHSVEFPSDEGTWDDDIPAS